MPTPCINADNEKVAYECPGPLTFTHFETEIRNPTLSECGRFVVDPVYYGFNEHHTGGGCTALMKELDDGEYMLLTDEDGMFPPMFGGDGWLGRYDADGMPIMQIKISDIPLED